MNIDGACQCGQFKYEGDIDLAKAICHCADCQIVSGTAFRVVVYVQRKTFKVIAGDLKAYIKTADSGARRAQWFCPDCATPIYGSAADNAQSGISIRLGTIRQRSELTPKKQVWCRSALLWVDDLAQIEKMM